MPCKDPGMGRSTAAPCRWMRRHWPSRRPRRKRRAAERRKPLVDWTWNRQNFGRSRQERCSMEPAPPEPGCRRAPGCQRPAPRQEGPYRFRVERLETVPDARHRAPESWSRPWQARRPHNRLARRPVGSRAQNIPGRSCGRAPCPTARDHTTPPFRCRPRSCLPPSAELSSSRLCAASHWDQPWSMAQRAGRAIGGLEPGRQGPQAGGRENPLER